MAKKLLSNLTVNNETLYMYDEDAYHGTVPTKTSDLQNDSGFIDNTVNLISLMLNKQLRSQKF